MFPSASLSVGLLALTSALSVGSAAAADNTTWPYQVYQSSPNEPPSLNITKHGATSPGYLFFSQTGLGAHNYSVFIMTDDNELVWQHGYGLFANFRVQQFQGKPVLTFFQGVELPEPWGFGFGNVQILDQAYESVYNVTVESGERIQTPGLNTTGWLSYIDMHEAIITPDDTMLITVNNVTQANLSSVGGPEDGWIVDSLFYEVDIKTNTTLYRWSHLDHLDQIPLTDALAYYPLEDLGRNQSYPWGPFHINSVEKFTDGSYLISSRFYCSIFKIGLNGSVEWTLNGQNGGDFTLGEDLSFCYQHDARIHKETTTTTNTTSYLISLFDNANSGADSSANGLTTTRGLIFTLDPTTKAATLTRQLTDPDDALRSVSQGNLQLLGEEGEGHAIMGYGSVSKIKEYAADGSVVMSAQFGEPLLTQSYRAFRFPWEGKPSTTPDVYACSTDGNGNGNDNGTRVWMSWNGATEVSGWEVLVGRDGEEEQMAVGARVKKNGFETMAVVAGWASVVKVRAEGRNGTEGVSEVVRVESCE